MNKLSAKKLLNSKWTAVTPEQSEKHFVITDVEYDEEGIVVSCTLEAVMTKNDYAIDWRDLKDTSLWRQGWK